MLHLIYVFFVVYGFLSNMVAARVDYGYEIPLKQLKLNFGSRHRMPVAKQAELLASVLSEIKKIQQTHQDEEPVLDEEQQRTLLRLLKRNYEAHQRYSNSGKNLARTAHISNPEMIEKYQKRLQELEVQPTLTAEDYSSAETESPNLKKVLRSLRLGIEDDVRIKRRSAMDIQFPSLLPGRFQEMPKLQNIQNDNHDLEKQVNNKEESLENHFWSEKPKEPIFHKKTTKWQPPVAITFTTPSTFKIMTMSRKIIHYNNNQYNDNKHFKSNNDRDSHSKERSNFKKEPYKYGSRSREKITTRESKVSINPMNLYNGNYKLAASRKDVHGDPEGGNHRKPIGRTPMQFLGKQGIYEDK